ncbi:MAG: hypothetical protein Q4D94_02880, partial [Bacillota bacterium]|nr:hypothetical protein [Bacillota bacterium]
KAMVCNTSIHRFKSGLRLYKSLGKPRDFYLGYQDGAWRFIIVVSKSYPAARAIPTPTLC